MAYTKIHAIQATVHKAVDYICNPAKTNESILISSYECSPETAAYDFKFALSKTSQSNPNKAYHLIQSFLPDVVSYAYLRRHETELILHDGAENMLKRFGIDLKNLDIEKLRSDYNALYSKRQALQKTYKSAEKETVDLNRKLDNLNQYLDRTMEQQIVDKKLNKNTQSL